MGIGIRCSEGILAIWSGDHLALLNKNGQNQTSKEFQGGINDVHFWRGKVLVLAEKKLLTLSASDLAEESCLEVARRPSRAKIFENEIFIADKSGDVYRANLENMAQDDLKTPILGHVSLILDIDVNEKFIATAEQDEKIKISSRKNPFVIDRFLLGHSEFVTRVNFLEDVVVTTGGDGNVKYWAKETITKEFGKQNVVFGLSTADKNMSFAVSEIENGENSKIYVGKDLKELNEILCDKQIPLDSCSDNDAFYWLVENEEKQIDLFKLEVSGKWTKICTTSLKSVREEDKWSKLRKTLEKSEAYDQYLKERESGFKKSRNLSRKKRRKDNDTAQTA